jgi:HlyD family secretion protein
MKPSLLTRISTRIRTNTPRLAGVAALVVIILYMAGTFGGAKLAPGSAPAAKGLAAPANLAQAQITTLPIWYEAVGTIRPKAEATIAAEVNGKVLRVEVEVGSRVRRGQALVAIDAKSYRARLGQAENALVEARAAARLAVTTYERTRRLREQNAATPQALDIVESRKDQAEARVALQDQLARDARVHKSNTRIVSPMDGVVVHRAVDPGDLAAPGTALLTIHTDSELRLDAHVREGLIGSVTPGQPVEVHIEALDIDLAGKVEAIVPAADPVSRSQIVRVSLPTQEGLYPGMYGKLRLRVGERPAVLIPADAVRSVGQLDTIMVERDGRWKRRYVTLGVLVGSNRETLSGLSGNETVGW